MTKKQQICSRRFGTRSLSVILSLLMVLSMFAVVMTTTTLTAYADITHWFVSGNFNSWTHSSDLGNKINGGSGSVTINIDSSTYPSLKFKMVAYENGEKWCGIGASSSDMDAYQDISADTATSLTWDGGKNISYNLPAGTTQVTFKITVTNGVNYLTVSANGSGSGGGADTGQMTFTAPVNTNNSANKANNLFWATATYFDYLSDAELSPGQGWLRPIQAGTKNFNGAIDEWFPFYTFNRSVVKAEADAHADWAEPLYFGNFTDTNDAYQESSHHQGGTDSYGYREATNSSNVTRFVHIANNSDHSWDTGVPHVYDMNTSYQGLMRETLDSDGNLMLKNNQQAPYFNDSEGTPLEGYAKIVNSSFPFTVEDVAGKNYKKYSFNSKNAEDNVYFTWATDGGTTYPIGVNYGAGSTYGVLDGVSRFMYNQSSGYGIFPFNNASNNYKGTKTNANENLDYGFGIKTEVKFRVPAPDEAAGVNTASDPIYFDFTGDDDLWMYITDESGNSQLVLDMGGDHKESHGRVNFNTLKTTVDKTGTSGSSATKSFSFDYSKTYTMTVFYMERGLIESNCKMEFTMTPLGNNFIVTETVDTVDVNTGLQNDVTQLSTFGFRTYNNGTQISDSFYKDFTLSSGSRFDIPNTALPINSKPSITQYATSGSYLKYTSAWTYHDNVSSGAPSDNSGKTEYTDLATNQTTSTDSHTLINSSGNEYDYAEWQVDYVNTPVVTDVSISKIVDDDTGADHSGESFPAKVYIKLGENSAFKTYDNLRIIDDGVEKTVNGGNVSLRDGKTIVIPGVPVGARVYVEESPNVNYNVDYNVTANNPLIAGSGSINVTNTPINPDSITGEVTGSKSLDGNRYTGTMFRFMLEGVPRMDGDAADVIDTSSVVPNPANGMYTTENVNNGKFTITGLVFDQPGVYRYHVYEDMSKLEELDAAYGDTYYASDIYNLNPDYLVSFTVKKVFKGGQMVLEADPPVYYDYSPYEDKVDVPGGSGEPQLHTMVPDDFSEDKKAENNQIVFVNEVMKGSVTVNKTDQANNTINGVTFSVYAVDDVFLNGISSMTDEQKYDAVSALTPVKTTITGAGSFGDGVASLVDLPIYENGFHRTSAPSYQQYVMIETAGPADYSINKTVITFWFPMEGDDDELHYDLTYDYVNGLLKNPSTSGPGMTLFKIIGMSFTALAMLALGAYMLLTKKRKVGKHFINQ